MTPQQAHLAALARRYPGVWKQVDAFRAMRGNELPDWPTWCYLPLAGAYAIASGGGDNRLGPGEAHWVGRLGALAAWRVTQGIYRFDAEVFELVADTPLSGGLPIALLYRLPEWCVYVETPGLPGFEGVAGFYAHLEQDQGNPARHELRLVLDFGEGLAGLLPFPLHLSPGVDTLEDAVEAALDETARQSARFGDLLPEAPTDVVEGLGRFFAPCVSLLLYLCSAERDVRDAAGTGREPRRPSPVRTKEGPRLFPPDQPTVWETAFRLGTALRAAREKADAAPAEGRSSPRAHVRRAHWHHFWAGPREPKQGELRELLVKWLPPIPVKMELDELRPTIRHVRH